MEIYVPPDGCSNSTEGKLIDHVQYLKQRDEIVRQIHNRCHIYLSMPDGIEKEIVIATLLEDLHEDSQKLVLTYCVKEENGSN